VVWCFDEIQVVAGWESFVRRLLDGENVEVFLSGSSARLLSREVATSMRGRAMETGGFPGALKAAGGRERTELLQSYVDVVILRDVGERHGVGNLQALRAFVRHLLRHPARPLSISRLYGDFHSRGIAVSKGTLLDFLTYLEDAFLVFTLPGEDRGWRIENAVAVQLFRTCRDIGYVRTESGFEVDFLATGFDGHRQLIQVAADISDKETFERETRALLEASRLHRNAGLLLLVETDPSARIPVPDKIRIEPVWQWLLQTA
jgi:predicted AAA+ superfamily ATPase